MKIPCSNCNQLLETPEEIMDQTIECPSCNASVTVPSQAPPPLATSKRITSQSDAAMRILLPVGRSGYAIVAGYLGLVSILLVFAPFALIFGILGIRDISNNSEKHGMGRAIFGVVMGALFSILLLILITK
jgi:hypothetical protein